MNKEMVVVTRYVTIASHFSKYNELITILMHDTRSKLLVCTTKVVT
jgi:hypothetical protein